jgi:uncharacterized protein YecE (DUF72 family)
MGEILVGTCSWTDKTLIESGRFYPSEARSAEARLRYYASQFPIVEVDSSYYALPSERTSRLWVERTADSFIFDVKAFRLFTQHPTPPSTLPQDIREALPAELQGKAAIYQREIPSELVAELWRRFEQALLPLDSAGKLGVVLFQFPPWFYPASETREYMLACNDRLGQYTVAIEFRHNAWLDNRNIEKTIGFLRDHNLAFVCVDEPQGFRSSVAPIAEATADIGLVRFHGRNRDTWEKKGVSVSERFNYLYSEEELHGWAPKLKELAAKTRQLHVLFNNCHQDKAVANARQMALMLD